MQNNPNNPYDDVFNNLAKIVDEIVRTMPEAQHARIIGYTIVTRHPSGDPHIVKPGNNDDSGEVPYEIVETDRHIFITAEMPPDPEHAPYADIETNMVRIFVDDRTTAIMLSQPVDIIHSTYRIHRGVMDITLQKVSQTPEI
jgi:hypothetical protein